MMISVNRHTLDELLDAPRGLRRLAKKEKELQDEAVYQVTLGTLAGAAGIILLALHNPLTLTYSWTNTNLPLELLAAVLGGMVLWYGVKNLKKWKRTNQRLTNWNQHLLRAAHNARLGAAVAAELEHGLYGIDATAVPLTPGTWVETTAEKKGRDIRIRIGFPTSDTHLQVHTIGPAETAETAEDEAEESGPDVHTSTEVHA